MWMFLGSIGGMLISNSTVGPCPDYIEKGYETEYDCQSVESPTGRLFFSTFLAGGMVGGTLWAIYGIDEYLIKEKGIKKNYPLSLSIFPSNNGISLSLTYNF